MVKYNELTHKELFKLIGDKDIREMMFLYDKYSPAIYGMIVDNVPTRDEANAILYKTFVTFFRGQFTPAAAASSVFIHLFQIANGLVRAKRSLQKLSDRSEATLAFSASHLGG